MHRGRQWRQPPFDAEDVDTRVPRARTLPQPTLEDQAEASPAHDGPLRRPLGRPPNNGRPRDEAWNVGDDGVAAARPTRIRRHQCETPRTQGLVDVYVSGR